MRIFPLHLSFRTIFTLALFCSAVTANTGLKVVTDTGTVSLAWEKPPGLERITFSAEAALRGDTGISIVIDTVKPATWQWVLCRGPFFRQGWHRFYLRFDSPAIKSGVTPEDIMFLTVNFSKSHHTQQPAHQLSYRIRRGAKSPELACVVRTSADSRRDQTLTWPVKAGQTLCVEGRVDFLEENRFVFTLFCNGDSITSGRFPYPFTKDFTEIQIKSSAGTGLFTRLDMDEVAVSPNRIPPLPPVPVKCRTKMDKQQVTLKCAPLVSAYRGERHRATRWSLFVKDSPFPLFDAVETDPFFLITRSVPLPLDTGTYRWQVAFQNSYGVWGGFSPPIRFAVKSDPEFPFCLTGLTLSEKPGRKPVQPLRPGTWYFCNMRLKAAAGWGDLGYIIVWISHESHSFGHPANKGGMFLPEKNYPCNISFPEKKLYEKSAGSYKSRRLTGITQGTYLDSSCSRVVFDTAVGLIAFPFRLLDRALPGRWWASAYVVKTGPDRKDCLSNVLQYPVTVEAWVTTPSKRPFSRLVLALLIAAGLVIVLVIIIKQRRADPAAQGNALQERFKDDYDKMIGYIRAHLAEDLNARVIRSAIGLSERKFTMLLNVYNISSIPKLTNKERVDKAKHLLANTNKNIAEIGFELGFSDAPYFSRVFKEIIGLSPKEFREQKS